MMTYTLHKDGAQKHTDATTLAEAILLAEDWVQDGEWDGRDEIDIVFTRGNEREIVAIPTRGRHHA